MQVSGRSMLAMALVSQVHTLPLLPRTQTNVWYFVVGTLDLVNGNRIYLNGQLIDSGPISQTASNSKAIEIGKSTLIQGEYLTEKIDDIGIWNRALTQCEISALYPRTTINTTSCYSGVKTPSPPAEPQPH